MTRRPPHLRLVPPPPAPPAIKDITGEDVRCDCICGLWRHRDICTDYATLQMTYPKGTQYNTCQACHDATAGMEAEL